MTTLCLFFSSVAHRNCRSRRVSRVVCLDPNVLEMARAYAVSRFGTHAAATIHVLQGVHD